MFKLGVVDTDDDSALDYVQRILAYMNCSVTTEQISPETQRSMLSAYLLHGNQVTEGTPTAAGTGAAPPQVPAVASPAGKPETASKGETADAQPLAETLPQSPPETPTPKRPKPSPAKDLTVPTDAAIPSGLPILEVKALHLSSPPEVLISLPAPQLLQELLGRVLLDGIGRLFFERQPLQGRILWSQDGVLKSMVENIEPLLFQDVIDELKRLTDMPAPRVEHPKQVEVERIYRKTHLLLRLRVMPANGGEEATLQVLRGAALRFYQKQQLSNLSRDALRLAEELQRKVNEIRERTRLTPLPLENLPALGELVKNVEDQIEALICDRNSGDLGD